MDDGRHSWKEVRDLIRDWVLTRRYRPGDKLPRDADIAEALGCARSTVQRAMQDLSDSGVVERRRKGGTHVRPNPVVRATLDIPITRAEVEAQGGTYSYRLIHCETAPAPAEVQTAMGLDTPRPLLHVEALHLSDDSPYMLEDRWICTRTAPGILEVDLTRDSANEWLVRNKPFTRFDVRFFAINADPHIAALMHTLEEAALFVLERTTWSGDAPITTVRAVAQPGYQLVTRS